jgi:hypothetical protein
MLPAIKHTSRRNHRRTVEGKQRSIRQMKYDLAKELADAGFTPRSYVGARFYRSVVSRREGAMPEREIITQVFDDLTFGPPLYVYIPNLEDLIEACGRDFRTLDRDGSGGKVEWFCNNYIGENDRIERPRRWQIARGCGCSTLAHIARETTHP